jgi:Ca2+/H+ antiporter
MPRQVIAALLGLSPEEHNALQRARAEKMQRASSFF